MNKELCQAELKLYGQTVGIDQGLRQPVEAQGKVLSETYGIPLSVEA